MRHGIAIPKSGKDDNARKKASEAAIKSQILATSQCYGTLMCYGYAAGVPLRR